MLSFCYTQEVQHFDNDSSGISSLGIYNGNLAEVRLFKNTSVIFGPSINETSMLNFAEIPILVQFKAQKWQFYTGGQINWMLDRNELLRGNRFAGKTFGLSIPIGIRYNANENSFIELKYTRNMVSDKIKPLFINVPSSKSMFEFGAGYKF
jgi:hypothetical protein